MDLVKAEDVCTNRTVEVADEKEATLRMLEKLRMEMAEMRAIAQPEVTMNLTNRSLQTTRGPLGLMQKEVTHSKGIPSEVPTFRGSIRCSD